MPWREAEPGEAWSLVRRLAHIPGAFLQSPAWVAYQGRLGTGVKTLVWGEAGTIIGLAALIRKQLPLGLYYWSCPKGPLWLTEAEPSLTSALQELVGQLNGPLALCLRVEPIAAPVGAYQTIDGEPRATSVVDLTVPIDELYSRMHEKTRYNIRLAERHGLTFRWGGLDDFDSFWDLLAETAQREKFRTHEPMHYRSLLEMFGNAPLATDELACRLGLVEHQGELLAASLVIVCAGYATYLHGASSRQRRELMAPHFLHGQSILALKAAGCRAYDLWGVQPADGSKAAWSGLTRFKLGFGGHAHEAPGTFDYPLSPLYHFYRQARKVRRIL